MDTPCSSSYAVNVDATTLRAWPLPMPMPSPDGDMEARGHVLILGGSREMPGAVILAAMAALRTGAGKLTIATGASVAQLVALALPEARVIALAETGQGGFTEAAVAKLDLLTCKVNTILIGPGMQDETATAALVRALLPRLDGSATSVVLDACAMGIVLDDSFRFSVPVIVTPHAGEMAHLTGTTKEAISAAPDDHAAQAARHWNAVVALQGARTVIIAPGGERWQHEGGNVGLGTSGADDTLAGIIAGLAARGATLPQAACWGVALHGRACEQLAERFGVLGYLAREIPEQIPALMESFARP